MKRIIACLICLMLSCGCTPQSTDQSTEHAAQSGTETVYDWGITLSVKDVSAAGLTLVCNQSGGTSTGTLSTGSEFAVLRENNGVFEELPYILPAEQVVWTLEAHDIKMDGETEWEIQWSWLYGELEPGEYHLRKQFMDRRGAGDYDYAELSVPFTVPETMPENFSLRFSWWYVEDRKNIMDTGAGTLQKDLITDGTASAEFQPDQDFMKRLYALVCSGDLLDIRREMTSSELTTDGTMVGFEPNCYYEISVQMNGEQYLICGDQSAYSYKDTDEDALCFVSTVQELRQMIEDIPEWKSLPEAIGGYD
jgi:hypothetical protein